MLERERHRRIVKTVGKHSVIAVADLAEELGVSEPTIRRDINTLAERGEINRIRGGAEAIHARHESKLVGMPFAMSQGIHAAEKRAIARAAAQLITPGESILINGGTTTFALVEYLLDHELDILTNSFPIAVRLLATRNRIVLPGGTLYREQNIVLSPFDNDVIENFWGKRLFTGCYGVNRFGLMEADALIAQAQNKLLQRCESVVVMADSSKLRRKSSMVVASLENIGTLVTDAGASDEELEVFRAAGIEVIVASVTEEDQLQQSA